MNDLIVYLCWHETWRWLLPDIYTLVDIASCVTRRQGERVIPSEEWHLEIDRSFCRRNGGFDIFAPDRLYYWKYSHTLFVIKSSNTYSAAYKWYVHCIALPSIFLFIVPLLFCRQVFFCLPLVWIQTVHAGTCLFLTPFDFMISQLINITVGVISCSI